MRRSSGQRRAPSAGSALPLAIGDGDPNDPEGPRDDEEHAREDEGEAPELPDDTGAAADLLQDTYTVALAAAALGSTPSGSEPPAPSSPPPLPPPATPPPVGVYAYGGSSSSSTPAVAPVAPPPPPVTGTSRTRCLASARLPLGKISYDRNGHFEAVCTQPEHGLCRVSRQGQRASGVGPPLTGRPFGLPRNVAVHSVRKQGGALEP